MATLLARASRLPELRVWALILIGIVASLIGAPASVIDLSPWEVLSMAGAGALLWFTLEVLLHRWLLHMPVPKGARLRALHHRLHWRHHEAPTDFTNLTVPLWGALALHVLAAAAGAAIGGSSGVLPTLLGFSLAFGAYELAHFAAHVPYRPRTSWGRSMKRQHLWHHFKNERYWFGVTHPLLDRLLGTAPPPSEVPRSSTAVELEAPAPKGPP